MNESKQDSIKQVLIDACSQLAMHDSARLDAEILLAFVLKKSRSYLYTYPEKQLSTAQLKQFKQLILQRQQGKPIAYLTGSQEFWSLPFQVTAATLIPRPETELLVELTLDKFNKNSSITLLELGTGSGAIACALASERPHWKIVACDVSLDALSVAKDNARNHQFDNIEFIHSNWFSNIPPMKFDAIVSNPPYIASQDPHLSQGDVRFEPIQALSSGTDGLDDIAVIIKASRNYLKPDGFIAIEHGFDQQQAIQKLFTAAAFQTITCHQDLNNHPRITTARL